MLMRPGHEDEASETLPSTGQPAHGDGTALAAAAGQPGHGEGTASAVSAAAASPPLEPIAIHELFNMINNAFPMRALDFRSEPAFLAGRLAAAVHVTLPDGPGADAALLGALEAALAPPDTFASSARSTILVVAVDPGCEDPAVAAVRRLSAQILERCTSVRSIRGYVDMDEFCGRYGRCRGSVLCSGATAPRFVRPTYASEILPAFLYLGDYENGSSRAQLESLGITHVVDATAAHMSEASAEALDIRYLAVDLWDMPDQDIAAHFDEVNAFVAEAAAAGGAALLHCRAGISRSATLVLAYLLRSGAAPDLRAALRMTMAQRPIVHPNDGFQQQLLRYEAQLLGSCSLPDVAAFEELVGQLGMYWTSPAFENEFDRVPIVVYKQAVSKRLPPEFAEASAADAGSGAARAPKPFLRKGARSSQLTGR